MILEGAKMEGWFCILWFSQQVPGNQRVFLPLHSWLTLETSVSPGCKASPYSWGKSRPASYHPERGGEGKMCRFSALLSLPEKLVTQLGGCSPTRGGTAAALRLFRVTKTTQEIPGLCLQCACEALTGISRGRSYHTSGAYQRQMWPSTPALFPSLLLLTELSARMHALIHMWAHTAPQNVTFKCTHLCKLSNVKVQIFQANFCRKENINFHFIFSI